MKQFTFLVCVYSLMTASLFASPKKEKENEGTIERSWKDNAKTLVLEEVPTGDILEFAEKCYVFDNVLVVQNFKNSGKHILEFYDLKTLNCLRKAIMYGNGHNELIDVIVRNKGKHLLIDGFMNQKFAKLDVADYLSNKDAAIDYTEYTFDCQAIDLLDKDHFLVVNPYCFVDKKLKIKQDEPRLLKIEGTAYIEKEGMVDAIKVNNGGIMINYSQNKICYYSKTVPLIELYDINLNLIRTITGPDKMEPEYTADRGYVDYGSGVPQSYTASCFDDSYLYLAYEGRFLNVLEIISSGGKIENDDTWIFKLDWNGNVKDSFKVSKEKRIKSMSIGKDGQLYLCCEVEGVVKLFKTRL